MKDKKIIAENNKYLNKFVKYLEKQKLSSKTVKKHVNNVELYINDYLCYNESQTFVDGCYKVSGFLGDWYIKKTLCSNITHVKSVATSIKKFYTFLYEKGKITEIGYTSLYGEIKLLMPEWIDNVE